MRVKSIELVNFRGLEQIPLSFTERTTALVGINGVGKSSVLDALAISLSNLTARITGQPSKARSMSMDDIRVGASFARLTTTAELNSPSPTTWAIALNRKGGKHPPERSSELEALKNQADLLHMRMEVRDSVENPINLPLAVYYDVHRAVLDVPLRVREKHVINPQAAYNDALAHGGTDFRGFFTWFRNREDAENEAIRDNATYRDRDLSAVRRAIEQFTHFTDLRIRRKPALRMTVKKGETELNVMQLSDGEKCMLALVGDLARRLTLLNTVGDDPLHGYGVVLIDEIDLHLHPTWQRTVVASLASTFPNCQFIITTHSAQVLGELKPDEIILVRPNDTSHPQVSYGLDSSRVLEEIMGATSRAGEVQMAISALFSSLERNELVVARAKLEALNQIAPGIAELAGAQALLKRKEVLGR
jgi:predicted ATP-binding protein involved in virulence